MKIQSSVRSPRQEIENLLNDLPDDRLIDALEYLRHLHDKQSQDSEEVYQIVDQFEGLWSDYSIDDDDIIAARQEMWGNLGSKAL